MKIEPRQRKEHTDLVLMPEEDESWFLDLIDNEVKDDDGLIFRGTFEIRLSDGYGQHYVLLKGGEHDDGTTS